MAPPARRNRDGGGPFIEELPDEAAWTSIRELRALIAKGLRSDHGCSCVGPVLMPVAARHASCELRTSQRPPGFAAGPRHRAVMEWRSLHHRSMHGRCRSHPIHRRGGTQRTPRSRRQRGSSGPATGTRGAAAAVLGAQGRAGATRSMKAGADGATRRRRESGGTAGRLDSQRRSADSRPRRPSGAGPNLAADRTCDPPARCRRPLPARWLQQMWCRARGGLSASTLQRVHATLRERTFRNALATHRPAMAGDYGCCTRLAFPSRCVCWPACVPARGM